MGRYARETAKRACVREVKHPSLPRRGVAAEYPRTQRRGAVRSCRGEAFVQIRRRDASLALDVRPSARTPSTEGSMGVPEDSAVSHARSATRNRRRRRANARDPLRFGATTTTSRGDTTKYAGAWPANQSPIFCRRTFPRAGGGGKGGGAHAHSRYSFAPEGLVPADAQRRPRRRASTAWRSARTTTGRCPGAAAAVRGPPGGRTHRRLEVQLSSSSSRLVVWRHAPPRGG